MTSVSPNSCPLGWKHDYSSPLTQPEHYRGMCWPASLHRHTSDPEMSPAKAEEDAGGDCARRKGSESTLGAVRDNTGNLRYCLQIRQDAAFLQYSPIYPKWWEILSIFRSTDSQARGCCCL